MDVIVKGILTGLFLSVFIGATFFMLIETSMTRGFKAALWFDAGVILCDALIIAAAYFFTSWINRMLTHNNLFNWAGGLAFIGFGINYIVSRRREGITQGNKRKNLRVFLNGFFVNFFNPAVLIFWIGAVAIAVTHLNLTGQQSFVYFGTALGVVAFFDIIKIYSAVRITKFLNQHVLRGIYIASGVLMIALGVFIILK
jgi:threonine/homoserine/homoserine lactone efflux protein